MDEIFGQAFGGVGEGGVVPVFHKQHEVFDHGVDFERFWQILLRNEIVFNACGGKLSQFGAQIGQEYILALREKNCMQQFAFVVQW